MRTSAVKKGDTYVLNGTKMWTPTAPSPTSSLVYAKTGAQDDRKKITTFLIERTFKGFPRRKSSTSSACAAPTQASSSSNDCAVPAKERVGSSRRRVEVLMSGLDYERLVLSAGPVGIMQACMDVVLPYIRQRRQFGQRSVSSS